MSSWQDVGDPFTTTPFNVTECIEKLFGVDLNQNFPSHWMGGGASSSLCSDVYAGLYAADQIETQNVINFSEGLAESGSLLKVTDIHCCSDMWLVPTGWHPCKEWPTEGSEFLAYTEPYGDSFDLPITEKWAKVIIDAIYKVHAVSETIYPASGLALDWFYKKKFTKISNVMTPPFILIAFFLPII